MRRLMIAVLVLMTLGAAIGGGIAWANDGASPGEGSPEVATLSVAELLGNPVYDTEVRVYGRATLLGEMFCPCFELVSGGEKLQVWYGLMVEDDGTERPPVSVEGIENEDWIVVTGELKRDGIHSSMNDLWASGIEKCVDGTFNGTEVTLSPGDPLILALDSNPTTGFAWEIVETGDESVVQEAGHGFEAQTSGPQLVGMGGTEVWVFKTLAEGQSTISMEYSQPWQGGIKAAQTFVVTLTVN